MQPRRRLALLSAGWLLGLTLLALGAASLMLRSDRGQRWLRERIEVAIGEFMDGRGAVTLHGLRLVPVGRVAADSIVITDRTGATVVSTGAFLGRIALGALFDRVLVIDSLRLTDPSFELVQDAGGEWNIAGLVPEASDDAPTGRPWQVRINSLAMTGGAVRMTQPDSLPDLPPVRTTVTGIDVTLGASTFAPDTRRGSFAIDRLAFASSDPPLDVRDASGRIELFADSAQLDVPRVALGNSAMALRGTVAFAKGEEDIRLALDLDATRVDLADIAWITDLIPKSGSGRAKMRIENAPAAGAMRYRFTELAVSATGTELRGGMFMDVGPGDDIAVRDLDLTAAPLDLRLVREIFGDSSPPPPWDGTVRGRLRASGGPLTAWRIDPSTIVFEDRRVGSAQSRFTIAGTMDLLAEQTVFKPLDIRIDSMDVRTAGGVTEIADSLRGYLTGRVRIAGPLDNIVFRDLDLLHIDGDLPRSHVRGEGRIAEDESTVWLEARLALDTVGVASLGRAFSSEELAGTLHGSVDVAIIRDSAAISLVLGGEAGDLVFNGATSMDTTRLVMQGELALWEFDARKLLPAMALPAHSLTAHATLGINGPWEEPTGPVEFTIDSSSTIASLVFEEARGSLALEAGGVRIDTIVARGPVGDLSARGRLSRDPALRDTVRFAMNLADVRELRGFFPDSLAAAWSDSLHGRAALSGIALGSLDTMDVRVVLSADSVMVGSYSVRRIDADLLLDGVPSATRGLVTFDAVDVGGAGLPVHRISAEATVREAAWADASVRLVAADTLFASARADVHYMGDSLQVRIDSLDARTADARWSLLRPTGIFSGPDRIVVDSLELRSADGARFAINGRIETDGPLAMEAHALRVPLAHARFTGLMPPRVNGELTFDARVDGTVDSPLLAFDLRLDSTRVDGRMAPELSMQGTYAERIAAVSVNARSLQRDAFTLTAELPLDLSFRGQAFAERLVKAPLYIRLVADGSPLAGFEALMPGIRDLRGGFDADVQVTGEWDTLEPRGILLVREGSFSVPALGTGFRELDMDVGLAPDSIVLYQARLADDRSANDTASVTGTIARVNGVWRADLQTMARSLRVIDDPRVAEADVSWTLRLRGALDSLSLGGDITVPTANIFIGDQQRRVLQLEEDLAADSASAKYAPVLEGLRLRLGNEVRLRSPEANVQLTGEVSVVGTLDAPDVRGEIFAERGTYRLDLGLLQRTFQVDSGLVRMNGPLSIPPSLDIFTSYTVRQAQREDVHITARINGTVEQPRLTLGSSDLGTTASDTEIISYLLFGAPTFVLDGQRGSAVRLATAALIPSLGGAAERALGAKLPFLSELQVVTVAGDSPSDFTLNSFEGLLNSFALTAGTQVGTDSYLRLSTGVCRGENRAAQSLPAWFGIAGEYRPRERLSAVVSLTPGSAPCNRIGTFAQIYQFGVDLYKDWRW
jgi:translocation and assembly module TamB